MDGAHIASEPAHAEEMTDLVSPRPSAPDSVQAQITKWVVRGVGAGAMAAIGWLFHSMLDLIDKVNYLYWALKWKGII